MRRTKIAFFAETLLRDFDGATRTVYHIIDRIDKEKYDVLFFCGIPPNDSFPFEVFHVPTLNIPFNKDYNIASVFGMGERLERRLRMFSPDVIHISTPSPLGYFALKYALKCAIPISTIYHTHFISYIKYYTRNIPLVTQALQKAAVSHNKGFYNQCSLIFAPTQAMKSELNALDIYGKKIVIWPRGIDKSLFSPLKRDISQIRAIAGNKKKNILFASRLVWEKNLKILIEIYKRIVNDHLPYNLIIAGDGLAKAELELQMPKAHFLGHQDHQSLSTIYASCDFFLFTSTTETFGNVIIEAMASGLPCVVADGGGSTSLINQGINGFLCKPDEVDDYLNKIGLLDQYSTLRNLIIQQALEDVKHFSWDDLVESFFDQITDLVSHVGSSKNSKELTIQLYPQLA